MRIALAIAATEALNWGYSTHLIKDLRPLMLEPFCIIANPGFQWGYKLAQVIDMPVFGLVDAQMTCYPCPHAAWPEGAANVYVVSGL